MGPEAIAFLKIASTVASVVGTISSMRQQAQASEAQASVLEQQAAQRRQIAAQEAEDFRRRAEQIRRSNLAIQGAAGGTTGGSYALSDEALADELALQELRTLRGGDIEAARMQQEASLERYRAKGAMGAGYVSAAGKAVSGLSEVDWGAFKRKPPALVRTSTAGYPRSKWGTL